MVKTGAGKMKAILKRIIIVLVVLIIGFLAFLKVKHRKEELKKLKPLAYAPLPVSVAQVKVGILPVTEHYLAEIVPVLSASISSKISGYLLKMDKYEGDSVKKGEIVAEIDSRQIKEKISAIKADIEGAKSDLLTKRHIYERNKILYRNKAMSREEYEISKSAYDLALSRLKRLMCELRSAEVDLSYTIIKAPFDGVVTKRLKEPGDLIVPGAPILEIEALQKGYRILVRVPQSHLSKLKVGDIAYIVQGKKKILAKIHSLHPAVETGSLATVEIRVKKRPFGLPTYGSVGVDLVIAKYSGAIVPLRSILENVSNSYVFVARAIKGNIAEIHVVPVKILGRSGQLAVVKGDINSADKVVCADESILLRLHEGEKVYIGDQSR